MATFTYKALTESGRMMNGTLEAGSHEEATQQLDTMHLQVNRLDRCETPISGKPLSRNEFLLFNQQLASITEAGIPLEQGLRELARDIASRRMRQLITDIADDLEQGTSIAEAFEKRQAQFPSLYAHLLKAGVASGRLSDMLMSFNRQIELSGQTRRIVFEALAYPGTVLFFAAIIISGIFYWVIPSFKEILQEMVGGHLNPVTHFFLNASEHVIAFWIVVGVLALGVFLLWSILANSATGRRTRETLLLKVPGLGAIYHAGILARLAEALGVSISSGCNLSEGFRMAATTTASENLLNEASSLAEHLEAGHAPLEAGQFCRLVPHLFLYSVQLGIQRNDLTENLNSLAGMYTEQTRRGQAHLQAILMPLLIVLLGGFIAFFVIAIFLPMIQVVTALGGG
ncbi:type II secretion system F family protein [Planctomycetota bacterium]